MARIGEHTRLAEERPCGNRPPDPARTCAAVIRLDSRQRQRRKQGRCHSWRLERDHPAIGQFEAGISHEVSLLACKARLEHEIANDKWADNTE